MLLARVHGVVCVTNMTLPQAFVNHSDGFALQYNNPANSAFITSRIKLIRQHLVQMGQGASISADNALPAVACPAAPDAGAESTSGLSK